MSVSISIKGKNTEGETRTLNVSSNVILQTATDQKLYDASTALISLFVDSDATIHKVVETIIK